jgi:hypothetical protein
MAERESKITSWFGLVPATAGCKICKCTFVPYVSVVNAKEAMRDLQRQFERHKCRDLTQQLDTVSFQE